MTGKSVPLRPGDQVTLCVLAKPRAHAWPHVEAGNIDGRLFRVGIGDLGHLAGRQRGQTDPGKFVIDPEILVGTGRIAEIIQYRAGIGAIGRLIRHASDDVGLQCGVGIACRIYSRAETAGVGLAVAARRTIKILLETADVGKRVEAGRHMADPPHLHRLLVIVRPPVGRNAEIHHGLLRSHEVNTGFETSPDLGSSRLGRCGGRLFSTRALARIWPMVL